MKMSMRSMKEDYGLKPRHWTPLIGPRKYMRDSKPTKLFQSIESSGKYNGAVIERYVGLVVFNTLLFGVPILMGLEKLLQ
jgi:hypothetical protein